MTQWLSGFPSELAYGLTTALVLAICGWVFARVRQRGDDANPSEKASVAFNGPVISAERIAQVHLHAPTAAPSAPTPRLLPRAPLRFVNRAEQLHKLDALRAHADDAAGPTVAVLDGMHGVGKTATGAYWANRNRDHFPDGWLFGDFSKRRHAGGVAVGDVLDDFLRELGTPDVAIPVDLGGKRTLFQRLTANRRLLIVLDDVDQEAQALNTIPAGPGSLVLVTTNFKLEGLFREGARPVRFKPLGRKASLKLLNEMADDDRLREDPAAADSLIDACAGLPIALCVCGGRLAAHQERSAGWIAREIKSASSALDALSPAGDFEVAAVFDFAYRDLSQAPATLYRRLGFHPELDFSAPTAAALAGTSPADAAENLDVLHGAHLLDMPREDRYRTHELVRDHMRAQANHEERNAERERASRRLVDWYYAALRAADHAIVADRLRLSDSVRVEAAAVPDLADEAEAFAWFEAERRNVMAVFRIAFEREWDDRVWQFAEALWPLCASHKRFSEWIESHRDAIVSAQRMGDSEVEARMRSQLARAYAERGEFDDADVEMRAATVAVEACDNEMLKASVVEFDGVCRLRAGDAGGALAAFERAREMFRALGSVRGEALQDYHLGWALVRAQEYERALEPLARARPGLEETGDRITIGRSLVRRGEALARLGRAPEAREALAEAIAILDNAGIWLERAEAFETLADIAERLDEEDVARSNRQRAYRIYREFGHPRANELLAALDVGA